MTDSLSTIGSIATFITNSIAGISAGVSGNMVIIADTARQHVANYTGDSIGSNNISDIYQPAIVDFAKADAIDMLVADQGGENISLAELKIMNNNDIMSGDAYRVMGESKLKSLPRKAQHLRVLG